MKKQTEPGLQYLIKLGIRPAKDQEGIYKQLREQVGERTAKATLDAIWNAETPEALYALKNVNLTTALTFSGAYDGDIYRKACNWVHQHRDMFGKTILEVGCDCGIISCFLGKLFPDAAITSIDRTGEAIVAAKALAQRLGVQNVTFLQCELQRLAEHQYDTVFSMRTIHENIATREIQPFFEPLLEQAIMYGNTVADYGEQLIAKVREGGSFITIEKCEKNPMFLGWLLNLHQQGLVLHTDCYAELCCTVLGEPTYFQAISAVKKDNQTDNVYAFWCSLFPLERDVYQYHGWAAETFLQNISNELEQLVEGYYCYHEGQRCGKYAIWTLKSTPEAVLYYQGNGEQTTVGLYDATLLEQMQQQLQAILAQCRAQKIIVQKIAEM